MQIPVQGLLIRRRFRKRNEFLAEQIRRDALAWSIASASVEEIDRLNILQASLLAMQRAVEGLGVVPTRVLVDGLHCPKVCMPSEAIVKGDSKVAEIAAASILAKTARDEELRQLDKHYPQYAFAAHKGYPTAQHLALLAEHGVSPVHRRSYAPVNKLLA